MPRGKGRSRTNGRVRLPEIGRREPIRNWETLFGPPAGGAAAPDAEGRAASPKADNPIARGVELGYRVMDEYVQQGQRAAGLRGGSPGAVEASGTGLPQLTERMFQYASDFASVWMEAMGVMMRRGAAGEGRPAEGADGGAPGPTIDPPRERRPEPRNGPASSGDGAPPTANGTSRASAAISVAVEVTSRRPVRAVVDLRPGPIEGPLVVSELRARDPRRARLKGVTLEVAPDGKRLTIRLKVPTQHPPGEYVGAVVDGPTAVTRGTLTVTVGGGTS